MRKESCKVTHISGHPFLILHSNISPLLMVEDMTFLHIENQTITHELITHFMIQLFIDNIHNWQY